MKILELTHYSSGICGVWQRVKQEAQLLAKKHQVAIFTSNMTKGTDEIVSSQDKLGKIQIKRFPAKKLGGESFMKWDFEKVALDYQPDIIIAHSYRHPHTTKALKIAKKLTAKVFLVTHAPFGKNLMRSLTSKIIVGLYDFLIGKRTINKFNNIITITKWEIPYLLNLGADKNRLVYIPNGIPKEFFNQKKSKEQNKILFLGRISEIKNLETLIFAMNLLKDKKISLEIVGPAEKPYLNKLNLLIQQKKLGDRVKFSPVIYDLKEKIKKIDSCKIFVLPSKREAMPQSLIEAMARGKIIIASNNQGAKDLVENEKNGYLFEIGDAKELAEKIDFALTHHQTSIKKQAKESVRKFSWSELITKLEKLF